jgi:hypothetical protein
MVKFVNENVLLEICWGNAEIKARNVIQIYGLEIRNIVYITEKQKRLNGRTSLTCDWSKTWGVLHMLRFAPVCFYP